MIKNNTKTILIVSLFVASIFLAGCSTSNDWTGFYYKDSYNIGDQNTWVIQLGLKSKEDCQNWVKMVSANNPNFDYECGYRCRYDETFKTSVCKETVK